ncbi:MAG: hypothetical protein KIT31_07010 [Deltaproteobacteria bacterium]|nr:hypothetical protein [Deltaproteobacteria bacterium]
MLSAAITLWPRRAGADEPADTDACDGVCTDEDGPRTLGGHTYVPSLVVDWAFIVSQAASTSAAGIADFEVGQQRIARFLGVEGKREFVSADQTILGTVADCPWLALSVRAEGSAIIPRDRFGAVFVGGHVAYGGDLMAAVRLIRRDRFQATVIGDVGHLWTNELVPSRLPRSPHVSGDITTVRPALALAYTITPRVGVQGSASFAWRWFDISAKDRVETLAGSAAVTVSLHPVPFTVLVAGQLSQDYGREIATPLSNAVLGTGDTRFWGEVGLVYRGRKHLDLGAGFNWKVADPDRDARWFGEFRIAYYF